LQLIKGSGRTSHLGNPASQSNIKASLLRWLHGEDRRLRCIFFNLSSYASGLHRRAELKFAHVLKLVRGMVAASLVTSKSVVDNAEDDCRLADSQIASI
jgi:hypothetical protein